MREFRVEGLGLRVCEVSLRLQGCGVLGFTVLKELGGA